MKKKILEFTETTSGIRKQFWDLYPATKESVELIPGKDAADDFLKKSEFDAAIVEGSYSSSFFESFTSFPIEVLESRCITAVIRDGKRWWPRNFLQEALTSLIVHRAGTLNSKRKVYLVGTSAIGVAALVTLIKMGLGNICIFAKDLSDAIDLRNFLGQKYFDLDVDCLEVTQILTRGNDGGVLINTISQQHDPALIEDLSYLNFLQEQSLVVDCNFDVLNKPLFDEVLGLDNTLIQGLEMMGAADNLLLQALGVVEKVESDLYFNAWLTFLRQNEQKT